MELAIDTAYFTRIEHLNREHKSSEEFIRDYWGVYTVLSLYSGVDILLSHHHSSDTMCVSALFVEKVPEGGLLGKITNKIEDLNMNECRHFFVLGETTVRGGRDISLFDGRHVEKYRNEFHKKIYDYNNLPCIRILTGISEIDHFFNFVIKYIHDSSDKINLFSKLMETVEAVRKWQSTSERVTEGYRIYKVKRTDALLKPMVDLISICNNIDDGASTTLERIKDLEYLRIDGKRLTEEDKSEFPAKGKQGTVTDLMREFYARNLNNSDVYGRINAAIGALSIPAMAIVFQTITGMPPVDSMWPFIVVAFAIGLHFISALCSLFVFYPDSLLKEMKRNVLNTWIWKIPKLNKMDDYPLMKIEQHEFSDLHHHKFQQFYRKKGREFVNKLNNHVDRAERNTISYLDIELAEQVAASAYRLRLKEKRTRVCLILFSLCIILYAVASMVYAILWVTCS